MMGMWQIPLCCIPAILELACSEDIGLMAL